MIASVNSERERTVWQRIFEYSIVAWSCRSSSKFFLVEHSHYFLLVQSTVSCRTVALRSSKVGIRDHRPSTPPSLQTFKERRGTVLPLSLPYGYENADFSVFSTHKLTDQFLNVFNFKLYQQRKLQNFLIFENYTIYEHYNCHSDVYMQYISLSKLKQHYIMIETIV